MCYPGVMFALSSDPGGKQMMHSSWVTGLEKHQRILLHPKLATAGNCSHSQGWGASAGTHCQNQEWIARPRGLLTGYNPGDDEAGKELRKSTIPLVLPPTLISCQCPLWLSLNGSQKARRPYEGSLADLSLSTEQGGQGSRALEGRKRERCSAHPACSAQ